jgi:hypothetical protein
MAPGERKGLGLYRADGKERLDSLRGALPLHEWVSVTITRLEPHSAIAASGPSPRGRRHWRERRSTSSYMRAAPSFPLSPRE